MIRPARPGDAQGIAKIWNPIIRDTTVTFTSVEIDPDVLAAEITAHPYIVAEIGGQISGVVTYGAFRSGPGYARSKEHSIHVAPGARGSGVGRALLRACEDHARAAGVHTMIAGISGENPGGVAFHTALGYREAARLPQVGHKFGRWHDLILMQKIL